MAKHHLFLHIGPDAIEVDEGVREQLAVGGVAVPDVTRADLDRATLEIRRIHKAAGLKRKDVEGAWARVCRRTFRLRGHAFITQPGFWQAEPEQAALALDGLHGLKVHLITTIGTELPSAWSEHVKPGRVHLLDIAEGSTPFAAEVARLALLEEKARLDKSLLKLKKRRKQVKEQLSV